MPMSPRLLRPRAAGGFDPRTIAGLQIWLDSQDSSTVLNSVSPDTPATSGQTVRRWLDKSGLGRHADQATGANQPTLGDSGIQFNGTNSYMELTTAANVSRNIRYIAMFAVYSPSGNVADLARSVIFFATSQMNFVRSVLRLAIPNKHSIGARRNDGDNQATLESANAYTVGSAMVHTGIINYGASSAAVRINGQVDGSSSSFLTTGNTSDTASSGVSIGVATSYGGVPFSAYAPVDMREILVYTGAALTADAVSVIERYLGRRWGVTVA